MTAGGEHHTWPCQVLVIRLPEVFWLNLDFIPTNETNP
jgi:hypothetical protein